jgi:hypothetical protein
MKHALGQRIESNCLARRAALLADAVGEGVPDSLIHRVYPIIALPVKQRNGRSCRGERLSKR